LNTEIHVTDKRYGTGQRIIRLGNVTIEEIQEVLRKNKKAFKVFIGGYPLTIENFNKLVSNGEIHW